MSIINKYNEEEEQRTETEETINKYLTIFNDYKKNPPSLEEALIQMFISTGSTKEEAESLKNEIIKQCKNIYIKKKADINKQYSHISEKEANIISSYSCELKKNKEKSPYKLLNSNLVSQKREEGITNVSKYLYILLTTLRKLEPIHLNSKELYRGIKVKVNIDPENKSTIPYVLGNFKTLWAFTSTTIEKKIALDFLKKNNSQYKTGTLFTFKKAWGYDIQVFSKYEEKEVLIEPERKIQIIEIKEKSNKSEDIIYIKAEILDTNLVLDEENDDKKDNKTDNLDSPLTSLEKKDYPDSITIKYKIQPDDERIKIFGEDFIKNNQDNYLFWATDKLKIICDDEEYKLEEYFDLKNYKKSKKILEIRLNNFSIITDMSNMFSGCSSLLSLPDINKWEVEKITDMSYMFYECSSLSSLPDISNWNTKNVTDMSYMFCFCSSLESLPDISKWDISGVKNMKFMFYGCSSLLSLPDISNWELKNVTDMSYMFGSCLSLKSLPDISKWNISQGIDKSNMFLRCNDSLKIPPIFKN